MNYDLKERNTSFSGHCWAVRETNSSCSGAPHAARNPAPDASASPTTTGEHYCLTIDATQR